MGNSFQDQFLKLGLVKKDQVNKTKKKQHKQKKKFVVDEEVAKNKLEAKKAQVAKKDYNKILSQQQAEEKKAKEIIHQINQLIETNKIEETAGDIPYKFTDEKKVRKLYINQKTVNQLSSGNIAIVQYQKAYELVPAAVGKKIAEKKPATLALLHEKSSSDVDADDPYAEFEVPDDLMW